MPLVSIAKSSSGFSRKISRRDSRAQRLSAARRLIVTAESAGGSALRFPVTIRIDTPQEVLYYENGGILHYVLRQLLKA
jgi:aconitate hydratase